MFKRANKITALLVAAASVMSVVPAMAAERLGTKAGTVDPEAIAFEDGKYAFHGYKSDDDDTGIYYNNGEKDTYLEDAEDYDFNGKIYGQKYAIVEDSSDEYLLDLSTGKVNDDETLADKQDDIKSSLKKTFSKLDRYKDYVDSADDIQALSLQQGQTFGEVWYVYTTSGSAANVKDTTTGKFYGFVNDSGKYIDASKLANVYYYSSEKGKVVKVEKYNDKTDGITAQLAGAPKILTQDSDYLYAMVNVKLTTDGGANTVKYLQKISKAQGNTEDEAYLPKSVTSYLIDDNALIKGGDYKDAYNAMLDANVINYQVKGSTIYVTTFDASAKKVKTYKVDMKKAKEDSSISTITEKLDIYVLKKDGDSDNDATDYSVDVDGNVWYINKGKISKFDGKDKKDIYTCDRAMDKLNVYNEKSLVAWENGSDVYTTVGEGKAETATEAPAATPAKVGWDKLADGTWNFYDATGTKVVNNWVNVGGVWYFLKADGVMATGWVNQGGTWYFLKSSGAMATGWLNDNGTWYYLNASGAMLANTTVDGYKLGASGAWVK